MKIKTVYAREILDSRGVPTIETKVTLTDGSQGIASIPSGASKGGYEAVELRDKDPDRFAGLGVLKAVANVNQTIAQRIIGQDAAYQVKIDQLLLDLDGTPDKSNLGANAILSASQAVLEASAASYQLPIYAYLQAKYQLAKPETGMPTPIFNLINGGQHSDGNLDFQEFHLVPSALMQYHQALECADEIYQHLKTVLTYRRAGATVADEGGFAPELPTNADGLETLTEAVKISRYQLAKDVALGLDVAADFIFKDSGYQFKDSTQPLNQAQMIQFYEQLNQKYPLLILEDPLASDSWSGWADLLKKLGKDTLIVGDDLLCTNKKRVKEAIEQRSANAILIKPNQVGTITETVEVAHLAKMADWITIVSHRSGETNDDFIADLAVGIGADYTKFGAPARGERIVKYNRLLAIQKKLAEQLGKQP